jgi:hypothetical protein
MLDKNLFRFLQFRKKALDVQILEDKYGIVLPPIYRSFIRVFKPYFAHQKLANENIDTFKSFVTPFYSSLKLDSYTIDDDEFAFESFKELEEVMTFERSNKGHLKNLLFIANHGYSGGLLLGIGKENKDKIFHNTDDTIIKYIAEDIYDLLGKMHLIQYDFELPSVETSRLYKNWGEDFWRMKTDKIL